MIKRSKQKYLSCCITKPVSAEWFLDSSESHGRCRELLNQPEASHIQVQGIVVSNRSMGHIRLHHIDARYVLRNLISTLNVKNKTLESILKETVNGKWLVLV